MSLLLPESLRLLLPDGSIKRILIEDYLRGVVAAALPADAPLEAMKALAVASRTFAANTHRHLERGAEVCTTRHCQAWNERANPRAARAVIETRGIVATFNAKLIEAFYFEHCDGKTRDAKGVLMDAPAYLKSVACPCGFASLKGHGIGMCLRGMVAQARLGETYEFILQHFYSGVALEALVIDESTRGLEPIAPTKKLTTAPSPSSGQARQTTTEKPKPIVKPTPRVAIPKSRTPTPAPPKTETEKPARKTTESRRVYRKKIEQPTTTDDRAPTTDDRPQTADESTRPSDHPTIQPFPEPLITLDNVNAAEADDLMLFLAVEDVKPTTEDKKPTTDDRPQTTEKNQAARTFDSSFPLPPSSMPEEVIGASTTDFASSFIPSFHSGQAFHPSSFASPPFSMPEEMPSAGALDFLAPPAGSPEDIFGAPPDEFLKPAAQFIEPNLGELIPPIEKFYTPLDAPPTMPEEMPSFNAAHTDETPIAWAAPPPPEENAFAVKPPQVLMDTLPGPRIIAGNLPKAGMVVTIRDARGNSIVTVSGVAKQYGSGGFEAPLTDDGAYHVKFDGTELDVSLENETVFIYYQ